MSDSKVTVVVAWAVETVVFDGRSYAADLGARPGVRKASEARACIWLNRASPADVECAKTYAAKENTKRSEGEGPISVFVYPTSEKNPLDRARREVLLGKVAA